MYSGTLNGNGKHRLPSYDNPRQQRLELQESVAIRLLESWHHDWATDYLRIYDRYRNEGGWIPISAKSDRQHGRNYPFARSEMELNLLRGPSRVLCATNSYAKGLLRGLRSFVISTGFTYKATPKFDGVNKKLVANVQDWIDEFMERERWKSWERELFLRSRRDGEYFLRHFVYSDDGRTSVRSVEPEQITQRPGTNEDWWFGIRCKENDTQTPEAYWVTYIDQLNHEGEEVSCDEIVHFKANVDRAIKRGMPDFIASTFDALQSADKLRNAMTIGAAVQASIAGVRQHKGYSKEQVGDFVTGEADREREDAITNRTQRFTQLHPGEFHDMPEGVEYVNPPGAENMQYYIAVLDAACRGAAAAWNAPEWLVSASAQNMGAYTSSLVAESPFVTAVKSEQEEYQYCFLRTMRIVVQNAIDAGRLPADTLKVIKLTAEPPQIEHRDKLQEAQTKQIHLMMGVTSRQKVAQELGYDWDEVQADNEEYQQRSGGGMPGLPMPGEDGGNPFGQMDGNQTFLGNSVTIPAMESLTESTKDSSGHCHDGQGHWVGCDEPGAIKSEPPASKGSPGKHDVVLPKDPKRMKIDQADEALKQMGYKRGQGEVDLQKKTMVFDVTAPDGTVTRMTSKEVAKLIYSGFDKGGKTLTQFPRSTESLSEAKGGGRWITIGGKKSEDGTRSAVKLDGTPGYVSNDVEPLDKKWSWRARKLGEYQDKPKESQQKQMRFFDSRVECCDPIELPDIRQDTDYSCGAACVTSVCQFFGVEPNTEGDAIRQLGTSSRDGTDPERIITVLEDHGLNTVALAGMDLDDLRHFTGRGMPVICCIQAWPEEVTEMKDDSGHEHGSDGRFSSTGGNGSEKRSDVPSDRQSDSQPVPTHVATFKDKNGVTWARAKKGGEKSPVTGQHYKGGQWLPIHGLSPKKEKTDAKPSQGGDAPIPPKSDSEGRQRAARQPMSQSEIEAEKLRRQDQANWDILNSGPLGQIKWIGSSPNSKAFQDGRTNLDKWKEYASSVGEEKLKTLVTQLETIVHSRIDSEVATSNASGIGKHINDDDVKWEKEFPRRLADDDAQMFGAKKHLKQVPSSFYARQLLQFAIGQSKTTDDLLHLNSLLGEK